MKFVLYDRMVGLNDYINLTRANRFKGAKTKKNEQSGVVWALRAMKLSKVVNYPLEVKMTFYEPNKRRDIDNISSVACKVILDALVQVGIIADDNQKHINKLSFEVFVDKDLPIIS